MRENILCGSPFDQEWYSKVVSACALLPDFQQLPAADFTGVLLCTPALLCWRVCCSHSEHGGPAGRNRRARHYTIRRAKAAHQPGACRVSRRGRVPAGRSLVGCGRSRGPLAVRTMHRTSRPACTKNAGAGLASVAGMASYAQCAHGDTGVTRLCVLMLCTRCCRMWTLWW